MAAGRRETNRVQSPAQRLSVLGQLRRVAVHLETAAILESRADRSTNPALAALLRERALQRRGEADRIRTHLAQESRTLLQPRGDRPLIVATRPQALLDPGPDGVSRQRDGAAALALHRRPDQRGNDAQPLIEQTEKAG